MLKVISNRKSRKNRKKINPSRLARLVLEYLYPHMRSWLQKQASNLHLPRIDDLGKCILRVNPTRAGV